MCKSKGHPPNPRLRTDFVGQPEGDPETLGEPEDLPLMNIRAVRPVASKAGILLELTVEAKPLMMELDTGASVSEKTWRSTLKAPMLAKSAIRLTTYTGQGLKVLGQKMVQVTYGTKTRKLPLVVVAGDGPSLFGRNWLCEFQLDWGAISWYKSMRKFFVQNWAHSRESRLSWLLNPMLGPDFTSLVLFRMH